MWVSREEGVGKNVISGGAISQLAITVTISGLGFLAAFFTSLNCIPTTVGYIMKNSSMPMGMDNWAYFKESINCPNSGINLSDEQTDNYADGYPDGEVFFPES